MSADNISLSHVATYNILIQRKELPKAVSILQSTLTRSGPIPTIALSWMPDTTQSSTATAAAPTMRASFLTAVRAAKARTVDSATWLKYLVLEKDDQAIHLLTDGAKLCQRIFRVSP